MNLAQTDPQIAELIAKEAQRQETTLELIASENHVSPAVREAAGSVLTNKYAEGYPRARYYQGCGFYDEVESLAIERAKRLFNCKFANVQPHSGANANLAAFMAMMQPGDQFISLNLASGGHLSHGMKLNTSAIFFKAAHYELDPKTEQVDFDNVRAKARELRPKMILCGYSAYPRIIDFAKFREICDEVGAMLLADIAHIAGLVATGMHPSPFPYAHVVTTTTHKTLRGPRGGLILTNDENLAKNINRSVFPGSQGGPLMHIIAAKAVAFHEDLQPSYKTYCQQIVKNAKALAEELQPARLSAGERRDGQSSHAGRSAGEGCEPHRRGRRDGAGAGGDHRQHERHPQRPAPRAVTSGIRLGTPALTTRGLKENDIRVVADFIDRAITSRENADTLAKIRGEVKEFTKRFPMPH